MTAFLPNVNVPPLKSTLPRTVELMVTSPPPSLRSPATGASSVSWPPPQSTSPPTLPPEIVVWPAPMVTSFPTLPLMMMLPPATRRSPATAPKTVTEPPAAKRSADTGLLMRILPPAATRSPPIAPEETTLPPAMYALPLILSEAAMLGWSPARTSAAAANTGARPAITSNVAAEAARPLCIFMRKLYHRLWGALVPCRSPGKGPPAYILARHAASRCVGDQPHSPFDCRSHAAVL